jgi:hypothetical protein
MRLLLLLLLHWLYSPLGPWLLLLSFIITLQTVGHLGRVISSSQGLYLNTGQHKHRINTYTKHPCLVLFEPMFPASERAKTVHASDRSATVTGPTCASRYKFKERARYPMNRNPDDPQNRYGRCG